MLTTIAAARVELTITAGSLVGPLILAGALLNFYCLKPELQPQAKLANPHWRKFTIASLPVLLFFSSLLLAMGEDDLIVSHIRRHLIAPRLITSVTVPFFLAALGCAAAAAMTLLKAYLKPNSYCNKRLPWKVLLHSSVIAIVSILFALNRGGAIQW